MKRIAILMCIATYSLSSFAGTCLLDDDLPAEFNTCDNKKIKILADKYPGFKIKKEFIGNNEMKLTLFLMDYSEYGKPIGIVTEESITDIRYNGNTVTYYGDNNCLSTYSFSETEKKYTETFVSQSSNCSKAVKEISARHIGKPHTYRKIKY